MTVMEQRKKLADILKDMTGFESTWESTTPAPDSSNPISVGEYICRLTDGQPGEARTGTPFFKVTLKVIEGAFSGRLVWHNFYLTPKALPYIMRELGKIGLTTLGQLDAPFPAGLVVRAKIFIRKRDNGDEFNEVRSWELVRVEPEGLGSATSPVPAPVPPTPAPWAVDLATLDIDAAKQDTNTSFDPGATARGGAQ
jgi:hypothetical protein